MTETEIQKQILDYLKTTGVKAWRANSGKGRYNVYLSPAGTPDIIGYLPSGKFLGIEVKKPGEKPIEKQVEWMEAAAGSGCIIIVAHCLDDVIRSLEQIKPPADKAPG